MSALAAEQVDEMLVLRETAGGVVTLTLNRPEARNALSQALMAALQAELDAICGDRSVKAVVIGGAGPGFCAGHDLKEIRANKSPEFNDILFEACSRLMLSITELPQPVIAKVHGIATAAGCQLVATCDLAVASTEARFATPGVNIGLFCSTPMVALSRVVSRKQAMEMLLTGELVAPERARALGLINRVVAPEALDAEVAALASGIASKSAVTVAIGKKAFYRQLEMGLEDAYAYTAEVMAENMTKRDADEGIAAFIEKRRPVWRDE